MTVLWSPHRFTGGVLALDTTNTVVLRGDPVRSFDRFDDAAEIGRFAEAASRFRSAELGGRRLAVAEPRKIREAVIEIRETVDRLFRATAATGCLATELLQPALAACAAALAGHRYALEPPEKPFGDAAAPIAFEAALAVSALSLLAPERLKRIRICGNCGWLFLDASRNGSRIWCDMAVCGNRQKARRHYRRVRALEREADHARN